MNKKKKQWAQSDTRTFKTIFRFFRRCFKTNRERCPEYLVDNMDPANACSTVASPSRASKAWQTHKSSCPGDLWDKLRHVGINVKHAALGNDIFQCVTPEAPSIELKLVSERVTEKSFTGKYASTWCDNEHEKVAYHHVCLNFLSTLRIIILSSMSRPYSPVIANEASFFWSHVPSPLNSVPWASNKIG